MATRKAATDEETMSVEVDNDDDETPDEEVVEPEPSNGNGYRPQRAQLVTDIPSKSRKSNDYAEWATEIEDLRTTNLGYQGEYNDVPNCAGVAQGLKRVYGVIARSRGLITDDNAENKGYGTLYVAYPVTDDGRPDEDEVAKIKTKYAK